MNPERSLINVATSLVACCMMCLATTATWAQLVDFDDLDLGSYSTSETFVSRGVTFEVGEYVGLAGQAVIADSQRAPGSGREVRLENEDLLIIHVPADTRTVSFAYGAFCCDTGIVVNGVASPLANPDGHNFRGLDNSMLGGVSINVEWISVGGDNEHGTMTIRGPIATLAVSGTEFALDNVFISSVPEPISLFYVLGALLTLPAWTARCLGRSLGV